MAGMVPEDVYELTGASDPRLSPDGKTVAYSVYRVDKEASEYRGAVWLAAMDGSTPPRQFTSGAKRDHSPRWSPDGTRLAFVSNRERDAGQLYVIPADGGEPQRLTDLKEDASQAAWSPNGTQIVFVARVRDAAYEEEDDKKRAPRRLKRLQYKLDNVGWTFDRPQQVFVVAADGSGEPVQLTSADSEATHPEWSPDGKRIVFTSAREEDWDIKPIRDLYIVDATGGEPMKLTPSDGQHDHGSWSADGSKIACDLYPAVFDDPKHIQIAVIDVASGERRVLTTSLDRTCSPYPELREPIWDGPDHVLFAIEDHGNSHLYRVAVDGSAAPELVIGGDQALTGVDAVGGTIVHAATAPTSLSEVFAGDRQLTQVGAPFAGGRELVAPERFTAISQDGTEVEAWVMRPAGYDEGAKYPALLNVHGGPFTQYGNRFFDEFQVFAGAGYVVVYSNPRGSSGYSEAWGRAIRGPGEGGPGWGTVDYEDVMAVMDEAVKRFDFIDADKLGVMGGSYGGFMTSWVVGHTDRFQVGISERSVNQWVSMWGSSDFGWDFKGYIGSFLFEDFDSYVRMSPAAYAKDITTPLLILHSENDLRCPVEQGEHLFVTLRLLKREVEFVRFPAEGHELSRSGNPGHRVTRFEVILDWLDRHLKTN
jgi:dipeptidyl aminopeptidase/acylaminoacyl peptidase